MIMRVPQRTLWPLLSVGLGVFMMAGCSNESGPVALDDGGKHLYLASTLLQRYPMANGGRSPKSVEDLKKYVKNMKKEDLDRLGISDPESLLISPRDSQPYVFNWKAPTHMDMRSGKGYGGGGGGPVWIAYEQTGVGGKRYIALSMGQIRLVDEEGFRHFVK